MNLVFQGARVGGLREFSHLALEKGQPEMLNKFPDSHAGLKHRNEQHETLKQVFFSHPPDKRCNFM